MRDDGTNGNNGTDGSAGGSVLFRSFRLFRPLSSSSRFHGEVVTNETEATKEQKECVPSAEWRGY